MRPDDNTGATRREERKKKSEKGLRAPGGLGWLDGKWRWGRFDFPPRWKPQLYGSGGKCNVVKNLASYWGRRFSRSFVILLTSLES